MKNLISKMFQRENKVKETEAPQIKNDEKFDIYIHVNELLRKVPKKVNNSDLVDSIHYREINIEKGRFILLNGIKGIFKIENIYELGSSAQYRLELIRKNLPKNYSEKIEKINNYSTMCLDDSFILMP